MLKQQVVIVIHPLSPSGNRVHRSRAASSSSPCSEAGAGAGGLLTAAEGRKAVASGSSTGDSSACAKVGSCAYKIVSVSDVLAISDAFVDASHPGSPDPLPHSLTCSATASRSERRLETGGNVTAPMLMAVYLAVHGPIWALRDHEMAPHSPMPARKTR